MHPLATPEIAQLHTIAQLALGFAGFAGIILAIAQQTHAAMDRLGIRVLFQSSLGALFIVLLTFVCAAAGMPPPRLWRTASAMLAGYCLFIAAFNLRFVTALDSSSRDPVRALIIRVAPILWLPLMIVQVTNAMGMLVNYAYAAFLSGVVTMLVVSSIALVRAVTASVASRDVE